jgi:flagellar biosynthetic protein FliP
LLSIAPSILLMATCFTRVVIVLAFLRQAIGVQQLPPNQVLVGLSLFVTLFVMAPVGERIHQEALEPYMLKEIGAPQAAELAAAPVRDFVSRYTREDDLALFLSFRGEAAPPADQPVSLATLLPSYLLSELRTAFEIGFMLYLPFLVIDLVVASLLISMGMIVLPPVVISLPFKLMLFVLLDGWNLVIGSLLTGLS